MDSLIEEGRGAPVNPHRGKSTACGGVVFDRHPGGGGRTLLHANQNADNHKSASATIVELKAIKPPQNLVGLLQGWWITSRPSIPTIR